MCERHSFVQDRRGEIYNGGGFEESHTAICLIHGLDDDKVNKYEWQPPTNWPEADPWDGITKDSINFTEKNTHCDSITRYLQKLFPNKEAFETYFIDETWHGKEIETPNGKLIIACKPQLVEVRNAICQAFPGSKVTARGNSQVTAWGNSQVTAWENSQVTAWENSQVTARGNSQVTAWENSQVTAWANSQVTA
ncbi:MAG: hypothetical protein ACYC1U_11325, partial [Candidatus Aquicultorales bacterium]